MFQQQDSVTNLFLNKRDKQEHKKLRRMSVFKNIYKIKYNKNKQMFRPSTNPYLRCLLIIKN